jgi:(hydroxyamino)benzene mutase
MDRAYLFRFEQEEDVSIGDTKRRLVWHGMLLFLLGLVTGFAEPHFRNLRMALAAHLEGVMNGTFIIALGGVLCRTKSFEQHRAF